VIGQSVPRVGQVGQRIRGRVNARRQGGPQAIRRGCRRIRAIAASEPRRDRAAPFMQRSESDAASAGGVAVDKWHFDRLPAVAVAGLARFFGPGVQGRIGHNDAQGCGLCHGFKGLPMVRTVCHGPARDVCSPSFGSHKEGRRRVRSQAHRGCILDQGRPVLRAVGLCARQSNPRPSRLSRVEIVNPCRHIALPLQQVIACFSINRILPYDYKLTAARISFTGARYQLSVMQMAVFLR